VRHESASSRLREFIPRHTRAFRESSIPHPGFSAYVPVHRQASSLASLSSGLPISPGMCWIERWSSMPLRSDPPDGADASAATFQGKERSSKRLKRQPLHRSLSRFEKVDPEWINLALQYISNDTTIPHTLPISQFQMTVKLSL
jgi:hypothetical protein